MRLARLADGFDNAVLTTNGGGKARMVAGGSPKSPREAVRSSIGRMLGFWIFVSTALVGLATLVPLVIHLGPDRVTSAMEAESGQVEVLLQALPPSWAIEHFQANPRLLAIQVRASDGRVLARSGTADFSAPRLLWPGRQILLSDGYADVGLDVYRRDGLWRVLMRVNTRPIEQQATYDILRVLGLTLIVVVVVVTGTVLILRRMVLVPLEHEARHDSLTGLLNRAHFDEKLAEVINGATRDRLSATLLFIDLDRFKNFNDNFGHAQGDVLLAEVSRRLRALVPEGCVAARLGGDQFAVILPFVERVSDARREAEQILEALSQPYHHNQFHYQLSASIGVAMLPEHGATPEVAQRNADIAMYVAKRAGRGRVTMFDSAMSEAASWRKLIEEWLRTALIKDEFQLHYQPKLSMSTGQVVGAEALLRWTCSSYGPISPAEFIPVAEETGLIVPLGRWVLTRVLAQMARWRADGFAPPRIAVNVSANQFLDQHFLDSFIAILEKVDVPANLLDLEITESALMTQPERTVDILNVLRARGITVSLDDFGTGYSSLSYLKRFPVNNIKIDKSFISDLTADNETAKLVRAVISMTHSLGLMLIAEGVETQAQLDLLSEWGCDEYQGHLSSPAVDAPGFRRLVEESRGTVQPFIRMVKAK